MKQEKLLRLDEVQDRTGLSRSQIYADPEFPKQIKISARAVAWIEEEVGVWIHDRIRAAREREAA